MTINLLALAAAIVVLVRALCLAAHFDLHHWDGHRLRFLGLALSHAAVLAGAFGMAATLHWAPLALLAGVSGQIIFDRRLQRRLA